MEISHAFIADFSCPEIAVFCFAVIIFNTIFNKGLLETIKSFFCSKIEICERSGNVSYFSVSVFDQKFSSLIASFKICCQYRRNSWNQKICRNTRNIGPRKFNYLVIKFQRIDYDHSINVSMVTMFKI